MTTDDDDDNDVDDDDALSYINVCKRSVRGKNIVENLLSLGNAKRRKLITSCRASQH